MNLEDKINKVLEDLFPINRSLTGVGVRKTLGYIKENFLHESEIKTISSGTEVFDWRVPDEWGISDAYVKNNKGEKIINLTESNLHVMSYSAPVDKIVSKEVLLDHLYTVPKHPDWIPYRTSYYKKNWGFCCPHSLIESEKFSGPFEVKIDSHHDSKGSLNWLECLKHGETEDEILISTYCCHPSLANDNLSGIVASIFLFEYLSQLKTRYTYRLVIVPETIGAISFLSQANTKKIVGGMILSCVAGPDEFSIKEGFDKNHWVNQAAHFALNKVVGDSYKVYPFEPAGSDERQYSTPGFRIVTPSIHKSKYHEYEEYHTSADNLDFISLEALTKTIEVHKEWINFIESYCFPKRSQMSCEFQLGHRDLYPSIGGSTSQSAHVENSRGFSFRRFDFNQQVEIKASHLPAFKWLMHLADGSLTNFEIAEKSGLPLTIVNESIAAMYQKKLVTLT
jgi:aminopeptidase-like protein